MQLCSEIILVLKLVLAGIFTSGPQFHTVTMSSSERPSDFNFTLPYRTAPNTQPSMHSSTTDQRDLETQGLWTNKQYDEIEWLGYKDQKIPLDSRQAIPLPFSFSRVKKAQSHASNTVRRNSTLMVFGFSDGSHYIDDNRFHREGCQDPELDVGSSREGKLRMMEALLKEAEQLGTKEVENLMNYLVFILWRIQHCLTGWREYTGWTDEKLQFGPAGAGFVQRK
ncbi:hypothetical protein BKA64DRAFT_641932 [Cadophora sp. MPI-SDFR-AT-0126]|nr:hypothetical protein BKA64DRAFT_641932 [Leotiomycetes sp. MPI-SDFR-AT-0126]